MSAAPFTSDPGRPSPSGRRWRPRHAREPEARPEESELARLRREMPQFGFFFDGRNWWGVYGRLVIVCASDPDLLRQRMRDAVRRVQSRPR